MSLKKPSQPKLQRIACFFVFLPHFLLIRIKATLSLQLSTLQKTSYYKTQFK
jgi:hypothetical protein